MSSHAYLVTRLAHEVLLGPTWLEAVPLANAELDVPRRLLGAALRHIGAPELWPRLRVGAHHVNDQRARRPHAGVAKGAAAAGVRHGEERRLVGKLVRKASVV